MSKDVFLVLQQVVDIQRLCLPCSPSSNTLKHTCERVLLLICATVEFKFTLHTLPVHINDGYLFCPF